MSRSDIIVIVSVYAVCLLFLYLTLQLPSAAQIYPLCLIAGLGLLDTLFMCQRLYGLYRERLAKLPAKIVNDIPEIFKDFQGLQFIFVCCACIVYVVCLSYLGFYLSSFLFLLAVMFFLKVKPLQICLTILILGIMIYSVFTLFLHVPLPQGLIFS